ncbi:uncharacterized protein [Diadema antillarum]|uniref:uncharacterized protein n=1 Tax=Diadema antillarum TaxID=105358 RepID=UPI003A84E90D
MDRQGRHWTFAPTSSDKDDEVVKDDSSTVSDRLSGLTTAATTISETPVPVGAGISSGAGRTEVAIAPEPMDLDERPSCRYASTAATGPAHALFERASSGEGEGTYRANTPAVWSPEVTLPNTDLLTSTKEGIFADSDHSGQHTHARSRQHSDDSAAQASSQIDSRRHQASGNLYPVFQFPPSSFQTPSATRVVSSEMNANIPSSPGATPGVPTSQAAAGPRQNPISYHQQLQAVMKRLQHLGSPKTAPRQSQDRDSQQQQQQPQHRQDQHFPQRQLQPLQRRNSAPEEGANRHAKHAGIKGVLQAPHLSSISSQGTGQTASCSGSSGSAATTSVLSQAFIGHHRYPAFRPQSPTLSGMYGFRHPRGGASGTIRQLLQNRTTRPYTVPSAHASRLPYRTLTGAGPLSPPPLGSSHGGMVSTQSTQRRYSVPAYPDDVFMKEKTDDLFSGVTGSDDAIQSDDKQGSQSSAPKASDVGGFAILQRGKCNTQTSSVKFSGKIIIYHLGFGRDILFIRSYAFDFQLWEKEG